MEMETGPVPGADAALDVHSPSLRERYLTYRQAQGRELLNVIPREGVRSLLRHFRTRSPAEAPAEGEDLLEWLALRCGDLLPLPPFEVWVRDFHAARGAYASEPGPPLAPEAPGGEHVTVEVRTHRYQGKEWVASLAVRPQHDQWVGHIRFHPDRESAVFTTGDIFREASPVEVRDRFHTFDEHTLNAFLRSSLP